MLEIEVDWFKWNSRIDRWEFNHRSSRDSDKDAPTPRSEIQRKAWAGAKWRKQPVLTENYGGDVN